MKAIITQAKDCHYREEIKVNTLEDLKNISKEYENEPLFITFNGKYINILICNDYIG